MRDIGSLRREDFEPHVGSDFVVTDTVRFRLDAVEAGHPRPEPARQPFALLFSGPPEPVIDQTTLRLVHAELGELDVFVVPIGADDEAVRYEAVFT
jgi:hypothetical protein